MSMGARREEEQQEQEDVLMQLYDLYWFKYHILTNQPAIEESTSSLHPIRSFIDNSLSSKDPVSFNGAHSPSSVLAISTFDDESSYEEQGDQVKKIKKRRVRRCCGISKSLSELEFEEIKGFMDLGFEFSEMDKRSPRLMSILPGLLRLGSNGGRQKQERVVARPYLSEVWEEEKNQPLLMKKKKKNWKLPSLSDEDDMKNHLKMWAHAVASTFR